jgi:uncharacterized protein (DUF697 family)
VTKSPTLGPGALLGIIRESRSRSADRRPLVVAGAPSLVPLLARELRAGGEASAVREGGPLEGAAALVWIGAPDESRLREASLAHVPIIGIHDGKSLPYVLDTNLVHARPGAALPVRELAQVVARSLGNDAVSLAARLPVLREAVVSELIRAVARQNAMLATAIWVPGADMPVLTLNQARLVLAIALAHGHPLDRARLADIAGVVGAGFGFRAFAHQFLKFVPVFGWAAKGAIAWGGTRAVGEAAKKRFGGL